MVQRVPLKAALEPGGEVAGANILEPAWWGGHRWVLREDTGEVFLQPAPLAGRRLALPSRAGPCRGPVGVLGQEAPPRCLSRERGLVPSPAGDSWLLHQGQGEPTSLVHRREGHLPWWKRSQEAPSALAGNPRPLVPAGGATRTAQEAAPPAWQGCWRIPPHPTAWRSVLPPGPLGP